MRSPTTRDRTQVLETHVVGEVLVVRLFGPSILEDRELRLVNAPLATQQEGAGQARMVLTRGGVTRMSSALPAKLLAFNNRLKAAGGRLALCEIHPDVWEIFEI